MQPTIDLTCTYFEGLTQPSETCKLLNVRDSYRLKRLASAVQLRPWPPSLQQLVKCLNSPSIPKRFNCHSINPPRNGRTVHCRRRDTVRPLRKPWPWSHVEDSSALSLTASSEMGRGEMLEQLRDH